MPPNPVKPPGLTQQQSAGLSSGTAGQALAADPYNLSLQGFGDLANVPLQGAREFFGQPLMSAGSTISPLLRTAKQNAKYPASVPLSGLTATQAMQSFALMRDAQLAHVQDQLYRAGYYSSSYVPRYGHLSTEDISAFRLMLIGLASNPTQGTLSNYLGQAAQQGTALGTASTGTPKRVQLTNPDDLRVTLQKTVQDLYGGNLPEDDVQKFITAYQSQESAAQTAFASQSASNDFLAGTYNEGTGNAAGGSGQYNTTTVTAPPSASASAEQYVRTKYPNQVAATQFGNVMNPIINILKNPAV